MKLNYIYNDHALNVLKSFPDESIDCIITSPPYYKLRDYKVKNQIGQEKSLKQYINNLLEITAELKRILKPTGIMFWNHDSNIENYCNTAQNYKLIIEMIDKQKWIWLGKGPLIWYKPNSLPSSATKNLTHKYEPIFILVKDKNYWFNLDIIRQPHSEESIKRANRGVSNNHKYINKEKYGGGGGLNRPRKNTKYDIIHRPGASYDDSLHKKPLHELGKNPGNIWEIPTKGFSAKKFGFNNTDHYAIFPVGLIEFLIKIGCPKWVCKTCGKPLKRIIDKDNIKKFILQNYVNNNTLYIYNIIEILIKFNTIGWKKSCSCKSGIVSGIVLDPFFGSGTVGVTAKKLNRNWIGIEINSEYCKIAEKRIKIMTFQKYIYDIN